MKDSEREVNEDSNNTSEHDITECDESESCENKTSKNVHDHPFSIESILNGRTKRRKIARKSLTQEENDDLEENTLPLSALEEFTSKAFSRMKPRRNSDKNEEPVIIRERLKVLSTKTPTKKTRRKARTCFTNQQIYELERRFLYQKYLSPQDRDELSEMLNLSNAQVITWFQNRRAKLKRDIEEMRNDLAATRTLHASQTACSDFHCRRFSDCR